MTKRDFLDKIEEILEADAGSITGDESLDDLEGWDSLAVISFIAMVDETFGITLQAQKIADANTLQDLMSLIGTGISE
jgi:acyl carrier protein